MDPRVKVLRFVKKYALSLTSVTSVAIVCAAVTGFLHELHRTCHPDLKFWLMILAGRLSLRLVTRLYLEAAINGSASGDVLLLNKIIEILDVFGMVWFAVGNLLVLNNFDCASISPFNFYLSLIYILSTYLAFIAPSLLVCTLKLCPPRDPDDLAYLRNFRMHGTRSRNVIENLTRNMDDDARSVEDRERESRALTPQQSEFWKQWLEKYGCVQFNVRDRSEENGDLSFRTGDKSAGLRSDCSICLGELIGSSGSDGSEAEEVEIENRGVIGSEGNCLFDAVADVDTSVDIEVGGIMDENSLAGEHCQSSSNQAGSNYIVRYPCHGEHYFHASCLHSWLQVATQNPHNMPAGSYGIDYNRPRTFYEDGILERCVSCPCCRERPSPGTQGRLGTSIQGNIDSSVSSRAAAQYDASYTEATVSGNNVGNQI